MHRQIVLQVFGGIKTIFEKDNNWVHSSRKYNQLFELHRTYSEPIFNDLYRAFERHFNSRIPWWVLPLESQLAHQWVRERRRLDRDWLVDWEAGKVSLSWNLQDTRWTWWIIWWCDLHPDYQSFKKKEGILKKKLQHLNVPWRDRGSFTFSRALLCLSALVLHQSSVENWFYFKRMENQVKRLCHSNEPSIDEF